jgi:hypothetical protein
MSAKYIFLSQPSKASGGRRETPRSPSLFIYFFGGALFFGLAGFFFHFFSFFFQIFFPNFFFNSFPLIFLLFPLLYIFPLHPFIPHFCPFFRFPLFSTFFYFFRFSQKTHFYPIIFPIFILIFPCPPFFSFTFWTLLSIPAYGPAVGCWSLFVVLNST